ncbi:MAG: hypothetical protein ACI4B3_00030 [Prevotella sp.]
MMKSWDLIHWTHHCLNFDSLFTSWKEIGCTWAPETIFDEQTGRYMIYLTMRHKVLYILQLADFL